MSWWAIISIKFWKPCHYFSKIITEQVKFAADSSWLTNNNKKKHKSLYDWEDKVDNWDFNDN